jgi:hypothetical protein
MKLDLKSAPDPICPALPSLPPHSLSPAAPPRPPSAVGIGLPRSTRTKPREWWKLPNFAQLNDVVDDAIEDAEMGHEHQENWFLLFLDLNGSKCIYSTIASISLIATIDNWGQVPISIAL